MNSLTHKQKPSTTVPQPLPTLTLAMLPPGYLPQSFLQKYAPLRANLVLPAFEIYKVKF